MKTKQTYNPCDDCRYSYSKNGQESEMCKICEFTYFINQAPKEGKWLVVDTLREDDDGITWSRYSCSECRCTTEAYYGDPRDISKFCPNCGARMIGGNK